MALVYLSHLQMWSLQMEIAAAVSVASGQLVRDLLLSLKDPRVLARKSMY